VTAANVLLCYFVYSATLLRYSVTLLPTTRHLPPTIHHPPSTEFNADELIERLRKTFELYANGRDHVEVASKLFQEIASLAPNSRGAGKDSIKVSTSPAPAFLALNLTLALALTVTVTLILNY
jgi:hypothetical protein